MPERPKKRADLWRESFFTLLLRTVRELSADLSPLASPSRLADTSSKLWSKRGFVRQTHFVLNIILFEMASRSTEPPAMLAYLPLKHHVSVATSTWIELCLFPRSKRAVVHSLGDS